MTIKAIFPKCNKPKLCINYQLDAQNFFIYIIYFYMFRALMLIFRRSHYCIHAAYAIITL